MRTKIAIATIALLGVSLAACGTTPTAVKAKVHHAAKTKVRAPSTGSPAGSTTVPGATTVPKAPTGPSGASVAKVDPSTGKPTSVTTVPKKPVTTTPPAKVTPVYTAHVDPTFVQDPSNPLAVTYTYSASSNESPLPSGILNLITPGGSQPNPCSIEVGASVSSGTCLVSYPATGGYQVTTQYIPTGLTAITDTESVTIDPYSTTTAVTLTGGASLWTTTATVTDQNGNTVPLDYVGGGGPLSITFTDATTGSVVYSGQFGAKPDGSFSFWFANGALYDPSALALVNMAHSFSLTISYAGANGYSASTSIAVAIP